MANYKEYRMNFIDLCEAENRASGEKLRNLTDIGIITKVFKLETPNWKRILLMWLPNHLDVAS